MNPTRLQGFTPDEFERLCLELSQQVLGAESVARRGGISDPDQGIDIEATVSSKIVGIQCKTGKVTVAVLRAALRALIGYPHRLDRFILMCAQHPMPAAIDEFRSWSSRSETIAGPIPVAEIWDPDRIAAELDSYPEIIRHLAEETRGAAFAVPVARLASFVGREKELDTLADRLRQDLPGQRPLLIFGMGGIGKTSLAVEFAYKQRHSFPGGVFWLNGQEDLVAQCARLATLNGAATSDVQVIPAARAFLNSLRQGPPSLVILDDLDRPGLLHEPLVNGLSLAECGCQILATSRFVGLAAGGVSRLDLGTVSPKDALYLLASTSNRPTLVQAVSSESQLAMQLCQTLGYLPLAVQIAGSYLALHPEIGIAAYLQTLNARGSAVSVDESEAGALHFPNLREASVAVLLRLAYDSIRDEDAKRLFLILSLLPSGQKVTRDVLPLFIGEFGAAHDRASRSLAWLVNSGLVAVDDSGVVGVHPLARSFGSSMLSPSDKAQLVSAVADAASQSVARLLAGEGNANLRREPNPTVFLCYAGPDRQQVEQLFEKLQVDGFKPWMDKKSLLPGQDWKLEVKRAIETADFFVACISRSFRDRTYGHKEIKLALDILDTMPEGTIFLVPLRLEDCSVEDRLASRHWVDLFASGGYQMLLRALRSRGH